MQKFKPYKFQEILVDLIEKYPNTVIIKTRQVGITETLLSLLLYKATQNFAFSGAVFSLCDEDAKDASHRSRTMIRDLELPCTNDNVHELSLKQGGSIYFKNSSPQGSRSRALSFLFFDESGHSRNLEPIISASLPSLTMSDTGKTVYVSTPSSTESHFFQEILSQDNGNLDIIDLCQKVASGELYRDGIPGFYYFASEDDQTVKVIIHWKAIPKFRDLDERLKEQGGYLAYRKKKNNLSDIILMRDHNLTFLSGDAAIFPMSTVEAALVGGYEGYIKDKDCRYIAGLDTNTVGDNFLAYTIIKENLVTKKLSLVSMYRARKKSQQFHLYEIAQLTRKYKVQKIAVEKNSGGAFYLEAIMIEFPDLEVKGYDTTTQSKPVYIGRLLSVLERELLDLPDDNVIRRELLNFSQIGNQMQAISGTDDIVMSLAIALNCSEVATIPPKTDSFDGLSDDFLRGMFENS